MRLTLKDVGFPYMKVMRGRRWIGRVYKAADGKWACAFAGKPPLYTGGATALEAFREGGARYMGQPSESALRAANARARKQTRDARAQGRAIAQDMLSRDPAVRNAAFDAYFTALTKGM